MNKNYKHYGEILLLGPCSCHCYYCLGREMQKANKENQLNVDFHSWKNFDMFLAQCKELDIDEIYISSVETDPALYKHLSELIEYMQSKGFYVGIRTNAANLSTHEIWDAVFKCDSEISVSFNCLLRRISRQIAGENIPHEANNLFHFLLEARNRNKKVRVAIVINKFNYRLTEITLGVLSKYSDVLLYVQLRQVYKYYTEVEQEEKDAYKFAYDFVKENANKCDSFYESEVYEFHGLKVSFWDTVFSKDNVKSLNYFTNGYISEHNLLVESFEEKQQL